MDRFKGRCWLDWWANPTLVLGRAEADVTIISDDDGWTGHGRLIADSQEAREGFAFLCDLDPFFSLRFADESSIDVNVHDLDEQGRFTLTQDTGPTQRKIDHTIDLQQSEDHRDGHTATTKT